MISSLIVEMILEFKKWRKKLGKKKQNPQTLMSRKDKKEGKYSFPANSNNLLYFGEETKLISRLSS